MAINQKFTDGLGNAVYNNFFLSNEVEDQFISHLDLQQFCTVDNSLTGTVGMTKVIHVYSATNGTEKLDVNEGNAEAIKVSFKDVDYTIGLAQNRFIWNDEAAMRDDMLVPVGMKHAGTDMFNKINEEIYAEFKKTTQSVKSALPDFEAFVDAVALLNVENDEELNIFAFVSPEDKSKVRKALKDDLKYVERFARDGYIGTVAGVNLYTKKDATKGEIIVATKDAVTIFNKKGIEVEQERDANYRKNTVYSRKYYVVALTDATKAVKIIHPIPAET